MNSKPGVVHYLCGNFSGALIQNNRIIGIYNQEGSERLAFPPVPCLFREKTLRLREERDLPKVTAS